MDDNEYYENINFIKKSKLNMLNFNLKNKILAFLPPADILEHYVFLSEKFLLAISKSSYIRAIKTIIINSDKLFASYKDKSFNDLLFKMLLFFDKCNIAQKNTVVFKVNIVSYLIRRILNRHRNLIVHIPCSGENYLQILKNLLVKNRSIEKLTIQYIRNNHKNRGLINHRRFQAQNIFLIRNKTFSKKNIEEKNRIMFNLKEVFLSNTSIKHLNLTDYGLGNDLAHVLYLKEILEKNNSLTNLNLTYNHLDKDEKSMLYIKEALITNTSLTHLNLSNNNLYKLYLKEVFLSNISLNHLDLSYNDLDFFEFKEALITNTSLNSINLSGNRIGRNSRAMNYLKEILIKNKTLNKLNLSDNYFGYSEDNVLLLKEGLVNNTSLKSLNLSSNSLTKNAKAMIYINEIIREKTTLTDLNLTNN